MSSLSILIVDDHPLFRRGLRTLLESTSDMEVIGEAATGEEAVDLATAYQPDVVLMDLQMPGGGGLKATREIKRQSPNVHILLVTLFEDDDSILAALRAGAHGYILKDADEEETVRAIRVIGDGEAIFSPPVASRLVEYFADAQTKVPQEVFPELTNRERQILGLISKGETNADIAEQLTISLKTVRNHVSNIYRKLQVADRAQAVIRARDAGLPEGGSI